MKLEVGMYVRTKKGKIYKFESNNSMAKNGAKKYMVNCSHNIIDLIELGDLVKIEFEKDNTNVFEVVAIDKINNEIGIFNNNFEFDWAGIEQLKSIVTKEQFESMSYEVKD